MLERILRLTPDLVYVYDLDERRNHFANRHLATFLGYRQEELEPDFLLRMLHPEDVPAVVEHHDAMRHVADGGYRDLVYRAQHRDGPYRWLLSRDTPFTRHADGRVARILGVCRDITKDREHQAEVMALLERVQTSNEELRAAEMRLLRERTLRERIFESAHDAIVITDDRRRIVGLNHAALELFGYRLAEVEGQPTAVLYADEAAFAEAGRLHYNANANAADNRSSFQVRYRRADGTHFLGDTAAGVLRRPDGSAEGYLGIIRDVTFEVESREALTQANARLSASLDTLDQFAYVASHDMRTPLRGIRHIVNFLEEDLPQEMLELLAPRLGQLRERVDRMDGLLVSLLDFVRSAEGAEERCPVDIGDVLGSVERTMHYGDQGEREWHLERDLTGLPAAVISTYPVVLEHGLSNLLANAIVHHDRPSAQVRIEASVVSEAARTMLELRVSDDGPGVRPEHRERIFEVFRTLGNRSTTGMGLALTRRLAQRVGGSVTIDPSPANVRGATVRLRIPADLEHHASS
ncbi:MAG: PAS domain S-box protein [Myxococcota bacterium]